jgi:hypothetical protein
MSTNEVQVKRLLSRNRVWLMIAVCGLIVVVAGAILLQPRFAGTSRRLAAIAAIEGRGGQVLGRSSWLNADSSAKYSDAIAIFLSRGAPPTGDVDMKFLPLFPELEQLALQSSGVTDAGMTFVEPLKNLKLVNFTSTTIGDAGLVHLQKTTSLEYIELSNTAITDWGLIYLKQMSKLEELRIDGTRISDAGLEHLLALHGLITLDLSGTRVSAQGTGILQRLPSLRTLTIQRMKFTDDEVESLRKALPNVHLNL